MCFRGSLPSFMWRVTLTVTYLTRAEHYSNRFYAALSLLSMPAVSVARSFAVRNCVAWVVAFAVGWADVRARYKVSEQLLPGYPWSTDVAIRFGRERLVRADKQGLLHLESDGDVVRGNTSGMARIYLSVEARLSEMCRLMVPRSAISFISIHAFSVWPRPGFNPGDRAFAISETKVRVLKRGAGKFMFQKPSHQ